MNTLPLDCLVANFLACDGRAATLPDEEGMYLVPLDDAHWLGVKTSESGSGLLFFAHPGPTPDSVGALQGDEGPSEQAAEELEVGEDLDGAWILTADRSTGRYTLWIRAHYQAVGHAEFARIIGNLRWRFSLWHEVLASGNKSEPVVTHGALLSQQEPHGSQLYLTRPASQDFWPTQER